MLWQGLGHKEHRMRSMAGLEGTLKVISFQPCVMGRALRAVASCPKAWLC